MAEETFRLPDLGEGLTDAQLVSWRVQEGSTVEVNAPLCEVETAKAVVVIPSPLRGTVRSLHAKPGESVAVGAPLVTITASSDAPADTERTLVGYGPGGPESGVRRRARSVPGAAADNAGDVRAAPFVRQLAREKGVDLATVTGTGPGGRITRADVEGAAVGEGSVSAPASASAAADGDQRISVVGIRKAIARQMVRSVSTIPQFTEFAIFDATRLLAARAQAKASGRPLTPLPYFVAAVVRAVREYPLLNSSWDDTTDEIVVKRAINVGLAVNTKNGLLVPVLKGAGSMDTNAIAERATTSATVRRITSPSCRSECASGGGSAGHRATSMSARRRGATGSSFAGTCEAKPSATCRKRGRYSATSTGRSA